MEKKYKNGLVLCKFYPPHSGHLYLIDTAFDNCENVHVICTHNKEQSIPGEVRVNALKNIYKDIPNIKIYSVSDDGIPQYDHECKTLDEFYSYWVPLVYNNVKELDVVFTSENYGDDFAKYLGIEHFLVDKERKRYPISGTKIRSNPFYNWEFIPNEMKPFFVKRVVIMGPESVGKSTLTGKIATYFNTNFVEEYGRTVYEQNGNKVTINDFIPISKGRQKIEDEKIKSSNKLLICDTEDITTFIFSEMYCPENCTYVKNWFEKEIKNKSKYDLYILLKPDCDAIQDGTRNFLEERWDHFYEIKNRLIEYDCNYVEVGGDWDNRFQDSINLIKLEFNI